MTMAATYREHPAAALTTCLPHLARLGAALLGILGNDEHVYGYHLSKARLIGTGVDDDPSLFGPKNVPCVDDRAACAIDYAMDWQASGEHLEDVRRRCATGELHQITQLIGDPDLIPGAPRDIKDACYAAPSTSWRWVEYHGQGHVTWSHIGIGRRYANDTSLGDKIFGGWTATGRKEEDDMFPETLRVPGSTGPIPPTTTDYDAADTLAHTARRVSTIMSSQATEAAVAALRHDQLLAAIRADDVVTISPETIATMVDAITDGVIAGLDVEVDAELVEQLKAATREDIIARIGNG